MNQQSNLKSSNAKSEEKKTLNLESQSVLKEAKRLCFVKKSENSSNFLRTYESQKKSQKLNKSRNQKLLNENTHPQLCFDQILDNQKRFYVDLRKKIKKVANPFTFATNFIGQAENIAQTFLQEIPQNQKLGEALIHTSKSHVLPVLPQNISGQTLRRQFSSGGSKPSLVDSLHPQINSFNQDIPSEVEVQYPQLDSQNTLKQEYIESSYEISEEILKKQPAELQQNKSYGEKNNINNDLMKKKQMHSAKIEQVNNNKQYQQTFQSCQNQNLIELGKNFNFNINLQNRNQSSPITEQIDMLKSQMIKKSEKIQIQSKRNDTSANQKESMSQLAKFKQYLKDKKRNKRKRLYNEKKRRQKTRLQSQLKKLA